MALASNAPLCEEAVRETLSSVSVATIRPPGSWKPTTAIFRSLSPGLMFLWSNYSRPMRKLSNLQVNRALAIVPSRPYRIIDSAPTRSASQCTFRERRRVSNASRSRHVDDGHARRKQRPDEHDDVLRLPFSEHQRSVRPGDQDGTAMRVEPPASAVPTLAWTVSHVR